MISEAQSADGMHHVGKDMKTVSVLESVILTKEYLQEGKF